MKIVGESLTLHGFRDAVEDDRSGLLDIDLTNLEFVDPYGLVALASAVAAARLHDVEVRFRGPRAKGPANYVSRQHLPDFLDKNGVGHDLPDVTEKPLLGRLTELFVFENYRRAEELGDIVFRRLEKATATFGIAGEVYEAILEIANNAVEHAGADGGVAAAQVYKLGTSDQRIDFAIGDGGRGILKSLQASSYSVDTDEGALELALENDVSSSREPGRGHGLPDMCDAIVGVGGTVALRSGTAMMVRDGNGLDWHHVKPIPGTMFGASIPCPPVSGGKGGR